MITYRFQKDFLSFFKRSPIVFQKPAVFQVKARGLFNCRIFPFGCTTSECIPPLPKGKWFCAAENEVSSAKHRKVKPKREENCGNRLEVSNSWR
jgi:hypothetical protein